DVSRVVLATAGDRLVLERYRWAGRDYQARFEVEALCVTEVDAEGRVVAHVVFDVDDRRAASRELLERFVRGDIVPSGHFFVPELFRGMIEHDLERCRAALPD